MLQIKDVHKQYKTGGFVQKALDGVSLNLRESEFVAILGPSGSGKTTLLNIIGGLDRYDSGDLIINGISTKQYRERDWDSYRNHTIGFVFQSYNLIPHQTVLSNVELALTISGISKAERRRRAAKALEQVGLGEQLHKRPNQMSGGQMQRVAIARALVNDPDILLADEPTGALDSETSVQVMELLKEVAKDRLVVMVTHNPELAEAYATRTVRLKDGRIQSDSHPFEPGADVPPPVHKRMGKTSMSFLTALSLSFNNLRTKKARMILTSFAGSIGIIGIALIFAISNGVNGYIKSMEENTLSEYPLQIQSSGMDFTSMMAGMGPEQEKETGREIHVSRRITGMLSKVEPNDLQSLKRYLDSEESGVRQYANAVEYIYDVAPQIYRLEGDGVRQVNPDQFFSTLGIGADLGTNRMMSTMMNTDVFHELPENTALFQNQYDVKAGRWPERYDECVVVLSSGGNINDFMLYALGLRDAVELDEMIRQFVAEEKVKSPEELGVYSYEELLGISFRLVSGADYYEYDESYQIWKDKSGDTAYMRALVEAGEELRIVGVVQPAEGTTAAMLTQGIGYPAALTEHVVEVAKTKEITKEQLASPEINVFSGNSFGEEGGRVFDMGSLFAVDEEKLISAFGFAGIDLSQLNLDLTDLPELDLEELLGELDLSVSTEGVGALMRDLLAGYEAYAAVHPEADYSRLGESFTRYLQSPEVREKLTDGIRALIQSGAEGADLSAGLQALIEEIGAGYGEYAAANGLPDPEKMGEHFAAYLQTPEARARLSAGITRVIDLEALQTQFSQALERYMGEAMPALGEKLSQQLAAGFGEGFQVDPEAFMGAVEMRVSETELAELMRSLLSPEDISYESNLKKFGYADLSSPVEIDLYPRDFESKAALVEILDGYNSRMEAEGRPERVIRYADVVGTLMSSVTEIVDVISYVLVAFVAISLVVSSIMIGVITYISVLERKKEIGILRAIGASRRNVSQVFNAETFIIGLCAGIMGIGITLLLLIPANALIHALAGQTDINASLPVVSGIVLILLSIGLTLLGGLIPARKAAKSDPVAALRSE